MKRIVGTASKKNDRRVNFLQTALNSAPKQPTIFAKEPRTQHLIQQHFTQTHREHIYIFP
jgi:hypothetical protein